MITDPSAVVILGTVSDRSTQPPGFHESGEIDGHQIRKISLTCRAPLRNRTVDLLLTMTMTLRPDPPATTNSTAGSTECPDRTEEALRGFHDRFHGDHRVGHREGSRTVAGRTGAPRSSASRAASARTAWVAIARSSGCPLTPVRPGHGVVRLLFSEDGEPI